MKINNLMKSVGGALATLLIALGISMVTGTAALAQSRQSLPDRNAQFQGDRNRDQNRNQTQGRNEIRKAPVAVYSNNGGDDNRGLNRGYGINNGYRSNNAYQIAQSQGYQAGLSTGASDAQRGQSNSPQRSHYYRDGSSQAFRDGFVQGYEAGFRQYSGYNNGGYGRGSTGVNVGGLLGAILGRP
jgi:Ni/Co efflux regulator RcnB